MKKAAMDNHRPAEDFLTSELRLDGASGSFSRQIDQFWTFGDDRVFGGYTVALALVAAAKAVDLPVVLSCHALFVGATRSGPAQIEVETLVRGRSAASTRVIVRQGDVPTVAVQAWFGSGLPGPASDSIECSVPSPESCEAIGFREEQIPFMGVMDERCIDYPARESNFLAGAPFVDLWSRPRQQSASASSLLSQLFDVIVLDAHMMDPARRARTSAAVQTASLDLNVMWYAAQEFGQWRRVQVESGMADHGFAATSAKLGDESGALSARAMQQGRVRTARRSGGSAHAFS